MEGQQAAGPLAGVRALDFTVHAAGPFATMLLAQLGAQVIKVESAARPDITRRPHTMYGKPPSSFEQVNAGKMSVALNLKEPQAVEMALRLVGISDLVVENFRPGVMDRLGLGYARLRQAKPDIVLVSLSANGQSGPERGYAGYAPMFAAMGGLGHLTGYPDGPPVELRHPMDHTGGAMAAFSAVAALYQRRLTGQGQHVDVSLRDVASCFIGEALLEYAMNDREHTRRGNGDPQMAPHGVYRCRGPDQWVAIAAASQEEWLGLCRAMGSPPWAAEDRFADSYRRWRHREELDRLLEAWTEKHTPYEAMELLQREGVAATPSMSAAMLRDDPHLSARHAFPVVEHPSRGRQHAVAPPWRFAATPAEVGRWTPEMGEENASVFCHLLGLAPEEAQRLVEQRVLW